MEQKGETSPPWPQLSQILGHKDVGGLENRLSLIELQNAGRRDFLVPSCNIIIPLDITKLENRSAELTTKPRLSQLFILEMALLTKTKSRVASRTQSLQELIHVRVFRFYEEIVQIFR